MPIAAPTRAPHDVVRAEKLPRAEQIDRAGGRVQCGLQPGRTFLDASFDRVPDRRIERRRIERRPGPMPILAKRSNVAFSLATGGVNCRMKFR